MIPPELQIDAIDELILTAFCAALAKLEPEPPLPVLMQQQINQVGEALAKGKTDVIPDLEDIAKQHQRLNELYEATTKSFQRHYKTQERNKSALPQGRKPPSPEDEYLDNFLAMDSLQIFRASDSKKAAEEQLQKAEAQGKHVDYDSPSSP